MPPLLRRVIVVVLAIVAALIVAGLALALGLLAPEILGGTNNPSLPTNFGLLFFLATNLAVKAGILPAFIFSVLAEGLRVRALSVYAAGGCAIALIGYWSSGLTFRFTPDAPASAAPRDYAAVAVAGLLAGLTYWALAGRNAGAWRSPVPPG